MVLFLLMKKIAQRIRLFILRHKILSGVGVLLLAGALIAIVMSTGGDAPQQTVLVERGTVRNVVSVSGRVQPAEEVHLAFGTSGRVASMAVSVGERVSAGQHIASLESGVLQAEYDRLSAMLRAEETRLQQLYAGPSAASRSVSSVSIESAQADAVIAERVLVDEVLSARTDADIAVRTYLDSLFSSPTSPSPDFGVSITSGTTTHSIGSSTNNVAINAQRREVQEVLDTLYALEISDIESDLSGSVSITRDALLEIQYLADLVADAVNSSQPNDSATKTIYDSYKSNVVSARTTVASAIASLNSADQAALRATFAVTSATRQFDADLEAPSSFEVELQKASIDQVRAQLRGASARLAEARIVSPIRGVVTVVSVYPGEIASPSSPVITIISDDQYQVEAFIPEVDIVALGVGDRATISLDALGANRSFAARVAQVEPAQTDAQGVPTYRVVLFTEEVIEGLKPGMSADIDIIAQVQEDALFIPARAIVRRGGETFVQLPAVDKAEPALIPVTVGIRGEGGTIEIISGLREGEEILSLGGTP